MSVTYITPRAWLSAAQATRAAELVRPRNTEPRVLMRYINGALMTCGYYGDADGAKRQCPEVGRWIELADGSDTWRSEDGRTLVLSDYTQAPGAPA